MKDFINTMNWLKEEMQEKCPEQYQRLELEKAIAQKQYDEEKEYMNNIINSIKDSHQEGPVAVEGKEVVKDIIEDSNIIRIDFKKEQKLLEINVVENKYKRGLNKMINISIDKKTLAQIKKESKTWDKGNLRDVGVCASQETGQISGEEYYKEIKERKFYDREKNVYKLSTRNRSVKVFTGEGRDLLDVLKSSKDYMSTMKLVRALNNMNTVMINMSKRTASVPVTKKYLYLITGGTERKGIELFNKLVKLGIIREDFNGNIFFNPVYTLASNGISPEMYILFKKELDKVLPPVAIRDLQTIIYYQMNPEEMMKEMEDTNMSEEDVIEKARQYKPIINIEEEKDEIVKELLAMQKKQKAEVIPAKKRALRDALNSVKKSNNTIIPFIPKASIPAIPVDKKVVNKKLLELLSIPCNDEPIENYDDDYDKLVK